MAQNSCEKPIKYVYELPFIERTELCRILNQNDKWEVLAGNYMDCAVSIIQQLRKERNPTDELLTMLSHGNETILKLFISLSKMHHYQSMTLLTKFVDRKYHKLIENGEGNLKRLFRELDQRNSNSNSNDMKIGAQNFNKIDSPQANVPKVLVDRIGDNLGAAKILNGSPQLSTDQVPSNSDNTLVPSPLPSPDVSPLLQPVADISNINNEPKFSLADTALPEIPYEELARATGNWNNDNVLGKGGFGTVFRGTWKNTQVAIKKIVQRGPDTNESYLIQLQQSFRELEILNACRHDNILSLYAYSMGGEAPCLVYQFLPNGSLEDRLLLRKGTEPLNWLQRHEIAKGTARGLQFLHTIWEKPLIHGDIKSANILLDRNFEPKIGDFGLAREGPEKDSMKVSRIHGTRPYLPHEFLHGKNLSTKVDTYSYGIVLFELATGLTAYDDTRLCNKFLKDFIDSCPHEHLLLLKDQKGGTLNENVFQNLINLGKWCSNRESKYRPEMVLVIQKIDQL